MRRAVRLDLLALGALGTLGLVASPAVAHAEDERALSVGFGWATFSTPGVAAGNMEPPQLTPDIGGAASLIYERAIGSDVALRGELGGGLFYGGAQDPKKQTAISYTGLVDVGGVVRFDVLKYVPYAFGGIGAIASAGGPISTDLDLVIVIGGGLDVLTSRSRSWGIEGKLASFGGDITVFSLGLRGTVRWGYF
ncbi:MAG: hypothetical protein NT062_21475 [Proteobacteria bacterium]|nr:hypothetical protein [Pseudomonadota bacterium]